jgi:seryl-tRNA synthetase
MLDLALIRAEAARVKAVLARRGIRPEAVDAVVELDGRWAARQEIREALCLRRRRVSEEHVRRKTAFRTGVDDDDDGALGAPDLDRAGREVAEELRAVEAEITRLEAARDAALVALPNLVMTDVPDNEAALEAAHGPRPASPPWPKPFAPLAHWDLVEMLGLAQPATTSAGRGFLMWRGQGARLVRGLVRFMLDVHTREGGCEEVLAPSVVTRPALTGSAHLPLLEGKMYAVAGPGDRSLTVAAGDGDLFLAPRAEPHLAGLYAGRVLDAAALPIRLVSAGPALRRESHGGGAAGRGLLRLHEFQTVERYTFALPEQADEELARAVRDAETILSRLGAAYRQRLRPAPRLSHAAARTVDLDVWAPGVGQWLAVAALSNFTDYQARRTNTRYRDGHGRARLVHTVGGAAVALPHLVAALLENGQEADGSVRLPESLAEYVGGTVLARS